MRKKKKSPQLRNVLVEQHAQKFHNGCNYKINQINMLVCEPARHEARK